MIEIKLNKEAELTFKLDIEGSNEKPVSKLALKLKEGELLIEGTVEDGKTTIRLPKLSKFRESISGKTIDAKLGIYIGDSYFTPWSDTISVSEPISVKAEAVDVDQTRIRESQPSKPSVSVRILEDDSTKKPPEKKNPVVRKKKPSSDVDAFLRELRER